VKTKDGQLLLLSTLALVLVAGIGTPAYASLIGDTVHVVISSSAGEACNEDVLVVDPGVELPNCEGAMIDFNANSIWFTFPDFQHGDLIIEITYDFTDLDWTDDPNGILVDTQIMEASPGITVSTLTNGPHSIMMVTDAFNVVCPGGPFTNCSPSVHLDLEHSGQTQPIGGELLPIDTTALLLASVQINAIWMIPVLIGAAGISIVLVRKKN